MSSASNTTILPPKEGEIKKNMQEITFQATNYPSDLTDNQWAEIEALFSHGPNSIYHKRSLINGALYWEENRCKWKALPHDFPPYPAVQTFYRRACIDGRWEKILRVVKEWKRKNRENTRS